MGKRAGVLVRISDDREDERAGVRRQEADARHLAAQRGHDVVELYYENDTSAYKRRRTTLPDGSTAMRVVRPEYRRALADLHDGTIDVLIGYDLDRIARDPRDLEDLIDVIESTGRAAISVTGSLQLENTAGITMARVGVAMANQSSRDTARRVARARADAAQQGRWSGGGRRAYGLTPDRTAVVTAEADVLTRIAGDILDGLSLTTIAAALNAEGITSAAGRPWSGTVIRSVITKPAVAGRLVYRGGLVEARAPWPAILDEAIWEHVCEIISARAPRATGQLIHWLSGILVCGLCGEQLRANSGRYWCGKKDNYQVVGCKRLSIIAKPTEDAVERMVVRVARSIDVKATRPTSLAPDDTQLTELAQMWGAQEISLPEYRAARAKILERVTPRVSGPTLPAWVGPDLDEKWERLPPTTKRRVTLALMDGVIVAPGPQRRWSEERLTPVWR